MLWVPAECQAVFTGPGGFEQALQHYGVGVEQAFAADRASLTAQRFVGVAAFRCELAHRQHSGLP